MIELNLSWLLTCATIIGAIVALYTYFSKMVRFMDRQKEQDAELKLIRDEQRILIEGILACLQGLKEQGCNGSVTLEIEKITAHLNRAAH